MDVICEFSLTHHQQQQQHPLFDRSAHRASQDSLGAAAVAAAAAEAVAANRDSVGSSRLVESAMPYFGFLHSNMLTTQLL